MVKAKASSTKVVNYPEKFARYHGLWQWNKIKEYIQKNFKEEKK